MSGTLIKELREKRGALVGQMQDLLKSAEAEKRSFTTEEQAQFDTWDKEQDAVKKRIDNHVKTAELTQLEETQRENLERSDHAAKAAGRPTSVDCRNAFMAFALPAEERTDKQITAAKRCGLGLGNKMKLRFCDRAPKTAAEANDWLTRSTTSSQMVSDSTLGGNAVQNETMAAVERAMLAHGGMRQVSQVIRTNTGATLPIPTVNDSGNAAVIVGESTIIDANNIQFGQITMTAYKFSSQQVRASIEFMQDVSFNFPVWLGEVLGERIVRGTNAYFTLGTTAGTQPFGAITEAAASSGQITYDNIVLLQHAVDPNFRRDGRFMMHDTVLRRVKRLVDSNGQPLWSAGLAAADPDTILGKPYEINQDMATDSTVSTGLAMAFGAFGKYIVRDVRDVMMIRLDERYADLGQVAFLTLSRHDGRTIIADSSNKPIAALQPTT